MASDRQEPLRIRVTLSQIVASVPLFVTAGWFLVWTIGFLGSDLRGNEQLSTMAKWLWYEVMAAVFWCALPIAAVLTRAFFGALGRFERRIAMVAVFVPFLLFVIWANRSSGQSFWLIAGFVVFALVHAVAYDQGRERLGFAAVKEIVTQILECWGGFTLAFLVSGLTWVIVLEVLDIGPKSDETRQQMLMVCVGVWYFAILGVVQLLGLEDLYWKAMGRKFGSSKPADLEQILRRFGN